MRLRGALSKTTPQAGPRICGYLNDPAIIEIMLNPNGFLWIDRLGGDIEQVGFMDAVQAEALVSTDATALRITITRERPFLSDAAATSGGA